MSNWPNVDVKEVSNLAAGPVPVYNYYKCSDKHYNLVKSPKFAERFKCYTKNFKETSFQQRYYHYNNVGKIYLRENDVNISHMPTLKKKEIWKTFLTDLETFINVQHVQVWYNNIAYTTENICL